MEKTLEQFSELPEDGYFVAEVLEVLLTAHQDEETAQKDRETESPPNVLPDSSLIIFLEKHLELTLSQAAELQNVAVELSLDHGHFYQGLQLLNGLHQTVLSAELEQSSEAEILARTLLAKTDIYNGHSQYDEARECCHAALDCYQAVGDLIGIGGALGQLAGMEEELNRKAEAIYLLKQANHVLHLARRQDESALEPLVKNYSLLGIIYNDEGDFYKAAKYHELAMRMIRQHSFSEVCDIEIMSNVARFHTGLSHFGYAQKLFLEALDIASQYDLIELKMNSLHNLADIALMIESLDEGLGQASEALTLACMMNNPTDIARNLILLGLLEYRVALRDDGSSYKALRCLVEAREYLQDIDSPALEAEIYLNIAAIIQDQSPEKALYYNELAKPGLNNYSQKSQLLANSATLYQSLEQPLQALSCFIEARKLLPNDAWKERAELYISVASYHYENYRDHKAVVWYQKALVMFRQIGNTITANKQSYISSRAVFFHDAIAVALQSRHSSQAYNFISMAKSQSFLDMLERNKAMDSNEYVVLMSQLEKETELATRVEINTRLEELAGPLLINEDQQFCNLSQVQALL